MKVNETKQHFFPVNFYMTKKNETLSYRVRSAKDNRIPEKSTFTPPDKINKFKLEQSKGMLMLRRSLTDEQKGNTIIFKRSANFKSIKKLLETKENQEKKIVFNFFELNQKYQKKQKADMFRKKIILKADAPIGEKKGIIKIPKLINNKEMEKFPKIISEKKKTANDLIKLMLNNKNLKIYISDKKKQNIIKSYFFKLEPNIPKRKTMEDYIYIENEFYSTKEDHMSCFAVYDGFGGDIVALFLKENLHVNLLKNLKHFRFKVEDAFNQTFKEMETELKNVKGTDKCGSTATVILIWNNTMYTANVGNSSCFILSKKKSIRMSKDHECNDQLEVKRIKENKGFIFNERVFGSLALTRCLGNFEFKDFGVSAIPTLSKKEIKQNDQLAVLASDGIWTFLNEKELFELYTKNIFTSSQEFCENLVKAALERGSSDNISCIVLKF